MKINDITHEIIDSAYKVHTKLGPGLLESAYRICLSYELRKKGLKVEEEKALPLVYEEIRLDCGYRLDMLIEDKVIVELKTVEKFTDVHIAQVLTYLKFSEIYAGLLINFNANFPDTDLIISNIFTALKDDVGILILCKPSSISFSISLSQPVETIKR